jgi:hypothetical protein
VGGVRSRSDYSFVTRWFFQAPIEHVFAELTAVDQWPSWWRGVRAVELLLPSDGAQAGSILGTRTRNTWKSVLPYELVFDAEVVRVQAPTTIEVAATGQLVGRGLWELRPEADGTRVVYHWQVSTTRRWMNLLAPIARPLFKWNHDVVMRWGAEGLARRLRYTAGSVAAK